MRSGDESGEKRRVEATHHRKASLRAFTEILADMGTVFIVYHPALFVYCKASAKFEFQM